MVAADPSPPDEKGLNLWLTHIKKAGSASLCLSHPYGFSHCHRQRISNVSQPTPWIWNIPNPRRLLPEGADSAWPGNGFPQSARTVSLLHLLCLENFARILRIEDKRHETFFTYVTGLPLWANRHCKFTTFSHIYQHPTYFYHLCFIIWPQKTTVRLSLGEAAGRLSYSGWLISLSFQERERGQALCRRQQRR